MKLRKGGHMSLQYDHQHLHGILEAAHAAAFEFLESLSTRPAGRSPQLLPHDVLPEEGPGALSALATFRTKYEALLWASPGPRYLGFVTGGSTSAALAGDWLASSYDQNVAGDGDSIATAVERETLGLLRASSLFLSPLKGLLSAEQHRPILLRWLRRASGQPRDLELMFPNKDYGICRLLLCLVDASRQYPEGVVDARYGAPGYGASSLSSRQDGCRSPCACPAPGYPERRAGYRRGKRGRSEYRRFR